MGRKCMHIRLGDGTEVMACGSFPDAKACVVCGTFATRLCDEHAQRVGPNRDMCPLHRAKETQRPLFAAADERG